MSPSEAMNKHQKTTAVNLTLLALVWAILFGGYLLVIGDWLNSLNWITGAVGLIVSLPIAGLSTQHWVTPIVNRLIYRDEIDRNSADDEGDEPVT